MGSTCGLPLETHVSEKTCIINWNCRVWRCKRDLRAERIKASIISGASLVIRMQIYNFKDKTLISWCNKPPLSSRPSRHTFACNSTSVLSMPCLVWSCIFTLTAGLIINYYSSLALKWAYPLVWHLRERGRERERVNPEEQCTCMHSDIRHQSGRGERPCRKTTSASRCEWLVKSYTIKDTHRPLLKPLRACFKNALEVSQF